MATQQTAQTMVAGSTPDLGKLADPIERLAAMLADMGTQLGVLGEQLRGQRAELATTTGEPAPPTADTTARGTGGRAPARQRTRGREPEPSEPDRLPPPTAAVDTGPAPLPGEPVDTSFAEPAQSPAAQAAGAAPCSGPSTSPERTGQAARDPEPPDGKFDLSAGVARGLEFLAAGLTRLADEARSRGHGSADGWSRS